MLKTSNIPSIHTFILTGMLLINIDLILLNFYIVMIMINSLIDIIYVLYEYKLYIMLSSELNIIILLILLSITKQRKEN